MFPVRWRSFSAAHTLRHLRVQVTLLLMLLSAVGIFGSAWYQGRQQSALTVSAIRSTGEVLARNLSIDAADQLLGRDYATLEVRLRQYATLPNVLSLQVVELDGRSVGQVVAGADGVLALHGGPLVADVRPDRRVEVSEDGQVLSLWEPVLVGQRAIAVVTARLSLASSFAVRAKLFRDTLTTGTLVALGAALLLLLYLRGPLGAVARASTFAMRLAEHRGETMPVERSAIEFERLGTALNRASRELMTQERAVKASSKRLQAVLEHAGDGILTLDERQRIVSFNPAAEGIFGRSEADVVGMPIGQLFAVPIDFLDRPRHASRRLTALRGRRRDGSSFPGEVADSEVQLDGERFYIVIVRDATEREERERALRESEERSRKLAVVASRTDNAVVITDARVRIEWVNEAFSRITGYGADEVLGRHPGQLLQGPETDPDTVTYMRAQLAERRGFNVELINHRKDGSPYWVAVEVQPVFDQRGELVNYIAVESDITERKRAEAELHDAKVVAERANQAKSEFLSRMSHELRTPLNAILGFAQLLELDAPGPGQLESVGRILKAGRHLLDLINEVLDISRIEAGGMSLSLERVELCESVAEATRLIRPLADRHGVALTVDGDLAGQVSVTADVQRLKQVLYNLLSNAVKYNRAGGTVRIDCRLDRPDAIRLQVHDNGVGIAADMLDRLFLPFDRLGAEGSDIEGSGIGLALTQRLVGLMDGRIGVDSVEGEGSTFWVELPRAASDGTAAVEAVAGDLPPLSLSNGGASPLRVVYIEDNLSNLVLVERIFERVGAVELLTAMQGQVGLELVRQERPDLVLLDLHLPGMDGETVLAQLGANRATRSVPVVVVSADAMPDRVARLQAEPNVVAYLTKPLDVRELRDVIIAQLETAGLSTQAV